MFEDGATASAWASVFSPVSSSSLAIKRLGKGAGARQRVGLLRQGLGRGGATGAAGAGLSGVAFLLPPAAYPAKIGATLRPDRSRSRWAHAPRRQTRPAGPWARAAPWLQRSRGSAGRTRPLAAAGLGRDAVIQLPQHGFTLRRRTRLVSGTKGNGNGRVVMQGTRAPANPAAGLTMWRESSSHCAGVCGPKLVEMAHMASAACCS
jgi:hypothetical protein